MSYFGTAFELDNLLWILEECESGQVKADLKSKLVQSSSENKSWSVTHFQYLWVILSMILASFPLILLVIAEGQVFRGLIWGC